MRKFYLDKKGYLILVCVMLIGLINAQERVYVTTNGSVFSNVAAHDSWANATADLSSAINAVADAGGGEVWVGAGTYHPTESYYDVDITDPSYDAVLAARSVSFIMRNGVSIIGGFNGEDNPDDRTDYDYGEDNATRLSGDIGVVDDVSDNAFHVVYGKDNTDNTAVLSDVIVVDGYANGVGRNSRGGGIQTRNGGTYNNLTIVDNTANRGAGAYAYRGGVFNNCLFWYNTAREYNGDDAIGGGIYIHLDGSRLENCFFNNNRSLDAGGAIGSSSGEIVDCIMINNQCNTKGGAIYSFFDDDGGENTNGGIYKNCLIANNTAWVDGGGIFADAAGIWINCHVVNNLSQSVAGGIYSETGAFFTNMVIWGNHCDGSPTDEVHLSGGGIYTNSAIGNLEDLTVGTDLVSLNLTNAEVGGPNFISPSIVKGRGDSSSERNENQEANWQHTIGSALTDMGTTDISSLELGDNDLANNDRVIQDRIDIGAYELPYYRTTISSTGNGSVSEVGPIDIEPGGAINLDLTPDINHQIYTFTVNGEDRLADLVEDAGVYSFTDNDVQNNLDIVIEFISLTAYEIDVSGDVGGDVSPEGITTVYEGLDFSMTLDPSNGYGLRSVLVDDVEQIDNVVDNGNGTYSFELLDIDNDHTITVDFALIHTITINLSDGGSANYSGSVEIMEGNILELEMSRLEGYKLRSFLRDLVELYNNVTNNGDGTYTYTISDVTEDMTYSATFELYHSVTVSSTTGGTVSNVGVNEVFENDDLPIEIEPELGYKFTAITLGGIDVMGDVTNNGNDTYSYNVIGLTADIDLDVVFTKFEVVNITSGAGGSVSPTGAHDILEGEELAVLITPDAGYKFTGITLDAIDVMGDVTDNGNDTYYYAVNGLTTGVELEVVFTKFEVVNITSGAGGSVSPTGAHDILEGEELAVLITPDAGCKFTGITLDAVDVMGDVTDNGNDTYSYSVNGLTTGVELEVVFTKFEVVTITSGAGGSVSPTGAHDILEGEELTVLITPDVGFKFTGLTLDAVDVMGDVTDIGNDTYSYSVNGLTTDVELEVVFTKFDVVTITYGAGGTVSPTGTHDVLEGEELDVLITPAAGYAVASITIDGVDDLAAMVDNNDDTFSYKVQNLTGSVNMDVQFSLSTSFKTNEGQRILFYPNPADSEIMSDGELTEIRIFDATGNLVKSIVDGGLAKRIAVSDLSNGVYFISYTSKTGVKGVQKLMIKH
ncbi:InlB B-repeat-containing protein [Carboxylicivirga marina]|uniref:T9SS type A sorting domain-containing protein n=1 Tax=Carboxylicivirga marina TaxID=2800988 RepID=A0ABS1HPN7_9BACT|nr:T9SS type A sorting domain-containing protein [Carboxylicivirga marina]MBK3519109.1 T9SS type A sorting domain-containing protein [Carboxylicivirga marina]